MASFGGWRGPAVLLGVVVAATSLVVAVVVNLYPVQAAPTPDPGPPTHAPVVSGRFGAPGPVLRDDDGCLVDLSKALDHRALCEHDLGPVWQYDQGLLGGPTPVLCAEPDSVFGQVVPDVFPRLLDDGRRQVQEWLRVYPTEQAARKALTDLLGSSACGAAAGATATPQRGPVTPLGADFSQSYEVRWQQVVSDLVVLRVGRALIQVSVTPLTPHSAPHDPDVVQLASQVVVSRYLVGATVAPSPSPSPAS